MAETIYLNDGSTVVLHAGSSRREVLRQLIDERIGSDAARAFEELIRELEEDARINKDRADNLERGSDGYYTLCQDAKDQFEYILSMLDTKSNLNRRELRAAALAGFNDLNKNL